MIYISSFFLVFFFLQAKIWKHHSISYYFTFFIFYTTKWKNSYLPTCMLPLLVKGLEGRGQRVLGPGLNLREHHTHIYIEEKNETKKKILVPFHFYLYQTKKSRSSSYFIPSITFLFHFIHFQLKSIYVNNFFFQNT